MTETLAETIRSAQEANERARVAAEATRRAIDAARGTRMLSTLLRQEAQRLHASGRYNKQR